MKEKNIDTNEIMRLLIIGFVVHVPKKLNS